MSCAGDGVKETPAGALVSMASVTATGCGFVLSFLAGDSGIAARRFCRNGRKMRRRGAGAGFLSRFVHLYFQPLHDDRVRSYKAWSVSQYWLKMWFELKIAFGEHEKSEIVP